MVPKHDQTHDLPWQSSDFVAVPGPTLASRRKRLLQHKTFGVFLRAAAIDSVNRHDDIRRGGGTR
jgi:hypothetical protein